jgi:hypothetical protein
MLRKVSGHGPETWLWEENNEHEDGWGVVFHSGRHRGFADYIGWEAFGGSSDNADLPKNWYVL